MSTPVLHVLAGPNGSGKSTFAHRVLLPATHLPFVNADEIAAKRWPGDEQAHAYQAAAAAAALRERALTARRSLVTETVFSHPSKRDLVAQAQQAGYRVELHVMMVPVELAVEHVAFRVAHGGHDVPERRSASATSACGRSSSTQRRSPRARPSTTTHGRARRLLPWPGWSADA